MFLHRKFPSVKSAVLKCIYSDRVIMTTAGAKRPPVWVMIPGIKRGSVNVTLESSSHHRLVFKPRGFFTTPFSSHQLQGSMLLKAKLGGVQKFVRVSEPSLKEFLIAAFAKFGAPAVTEGVKVFDSSGTELDEDVFEDIVTDPSIGVLTIKYETGLETSVAEVSPERFQLSSPHSSDSQDTVILSDSPLRKRQKLDAEAKQHQEMDHRVKTSVVDQLSDESCSLLQRTC
ncbi:uncharacterized protein LOC106632450 [Haplochromis burtoni]|uniref:uncharacterized protein LOC106632450 n=1 Tax=Haplochromis burtoni TaxID=8153 RepID=UPI001C2DCB26|nr:uncharacterized protein LOC106632450 [Haplochromis burtoni]